MPGARPILRAALAIAVALVCFLALLAPAGAHAAGGVYVALGDSYTSGPLVPTQHGDPIDCARSDRNYPSLVAGAFRPGTFVDVSCASAQTKHMTEPQTELSAGGTNPPQFNGLRRDATLVTVGIGGNDAGLVGVATRCAQLGAVAPTGRACRNFYAPGGKDKVAAKIDATKPKIAGVLRGIHRRSPTARVAIVGYPDVLPKSGSCYPMVPLSPDDIRYIDELLRRINAMIARQAAANDAEFVDTYADSGGHDVCKLPPTRWFEGLVPTEPAFPLHPNAKGEASMARSAIELLNRPRPKPRLSRLRVTPRRVRAGRRARVSYGLDRAAPVIMRVRRVTGGRRVGNRCVRPRRGLATRRPCRRLSRVVLRVKTTGRAGPNSFRRTTRRLGRRRGLYRLTATPTLYGATGRSRSASYRVLRRRR